MAVREHHRSAARVGGHADVDAGQVERMPAGDVGLAGGGVRDVEAQRGSALELDSRERAGAGRGAERLRYDGLELVVFDRTRVRAHVHRGGLADREARVEDDDLDGGTLGEVLRVARV